MGCSNQGNAGTPEFETMQKASDMEYPWLIFQLKNNCYAINSEFVSSIFILPASIASLPEAPPYIKGILNLRGSMLPLVQLRTIFGLETIDQEHDIFTEMLEQRKQDHIYWAQELESCIKENRPFTLATDPHQCAFGKWYDNFESEQLSVNNHLSKIDLPHKQLHQCAEKVMRCYSEDGDLDWPCAEGVLEQLDKKIVPQIVKLLDETKEIFSNYFREMIIVLENKDERIGLIVDEVLSVDDLEMMESNLHINQDIRCSVYMTDVAKFHHNDQMVYLLDGEKLIHYE